MWKIELNEIEFLKYELKIETHINNEKIAIKTSILEDFKSSLLIEKKIVVMKMAVYGELPKEL